MPKGVKYRTDQQVSLNLFARSWPVSAPSWPLVALLISSHSWSLQPMLPGSPIPPDAPTWLRRPRSCRRHPIAVSHREAVAATSDRGHDRSAGRASEVDSWPCPDLVPWPQVVWPVSPRNEYGGASSSRARSPSFAAIAQPIVRRESHQNLLIVDLACLAHRDSCRSARASSENVQARNLHTALCKLAQSGEPSLHARRGVMTSKGAWLAKIS
jgi:hypothetical protein